MGSFLLVSFFLRTSGVTAMECGIVARGDDELDRCKNGEAHVRCEVSATDPSYLW